VRDHDEQQQQQQQQQQSESASQSSETSSSVPAADTANSNIGRRGSSGYDKAQTHYSDVIDLLGPKKQMLVRYINK
jgi:guanyl-specific ribonuclease Sa